MDKKLEKRKSKNFGLTFAFVFAIITLYFFFKSQEFKPSFLTLSFFFFIFSFLKPNIFLYPSKAWEKFGEILGRFISPVVLTIVYITSIIPIKTLLILFNVNLLQKKKSKRNSYWINRLENKINFKDQF